MKMELFIYEFTYWRRISNYYFYFW